VRLLKSERFILYKTINQRDIVAGFFYCCILFSTPSIKLFTFGGNYFPEISIVVCFLYYYFSGDVFLSELFAALAYGRNLFCYSVISLAALCFLGAFRGGDPLNSYAEFRSIIFFVIGLQFVVFEVRGGRSETIILFATIASIAGFFDWTYGYFFPSADSSVKYASPIYSAAVAGILGALCGREKLFYISIVIALICAVLGFYRQYWIIAGAVTIFGILCGRLRLLTSRVGVVGIFASIVVFIFAMQWFNEVVDSNESLYIQSVGKTNDLLGFFEGTVEQTESDALRQGYFIFLLTHPVETIFPFGLGSRAVYGNVSHWFDQYLIPANTLDSVWFYSSFHFGSLFTIIFIIILGKSWSIFSKKIGLLAGISFLVCLMMPIFFDGGALTVLPRAFWLGALFGIVAHPGVISSK
jgi:hypothetical protein